MYTKNLSFLIFLNYLYFNCFFIEQDHLNFKELFNRHLSLIQNKL